MNQTVLIVDDSAFVREALGGALRKDGVDIVVAKNGREALDLLAQRNNVRALVIDVSMPILGGKEVLAHLGRASGSQPFVVAVGSRAERGVLEECLSLGAHHALTKPLDVAVLRGLLRTALEHREEPPTP